jgi:hypothetical protein
VAGRLTRGLKDASADSTETAEPATAPGLGTLPAQSAQPAQPADVAGYPSYGEGVPVVTDDQVSYRNAL